MPGGFAEISAVELGSTAIAESISRSGVEAKDVDEVLIGNGLSAGRGQNVARQVAGVPQSIGAIERLFQTTGLTERDVDLIEINDAVNVNGSAVALDHRISTSGTCILVTLLQALEQRCTTVEVTAICIGGGEALAVADQPFHETTHNYPPDALSVP